MSLAMCFGGFAAGLRCGDLPADVVEDLKLRLLDLLGAAISGIGAGTWRPFEREPASGNAHLWARGKKGAPTDAAFLNSFVSHATYMEDGSRFSGGHPSSVVIPAALAAVEGRRHADGMALLLAIAAGYEVFLRLGRAVYPEIVRRGHQSTAALGAVASAAAVASAYRLSDAEAGHAIAIAATLGFGLKHALKASGSQPVQVARSCEGGVIAAEAAAKGATGAPDILEAALLPILGGTVGPGVVMEDLGRRFSVAETYIKLHGGCRGNHAPIDLVQDLLMRSRRSVQQIAEIRIDVDSVTHAADIERPETPAQAQFSARYAIAAHLLTGDALPERYNAARLADPDQRALMERITVRANPALDAGYPSRRGAHARIDFIDGTTLEGTLSNARGEPEEPVSSSDVEAKFMRLAEPALGVDASRLRDLVTDLDRLADVTLISALLARAAQRNARDDMTRRAVEEMTS